MKLKSGDVVLYPGSSHGDFVVLSSFVYDSNVWEYHSVMCLEDGSRIVKAIYAPTFPSSNMIYLPSGEERRSAGSSGNLSE